MRPGGRAQAAIEVLDAWLSTDEGLDRVLTRWGREHRFAGSGDRHAIADLVYDACRRMRSAAWVAGAVDPTRCPAGTAAPGRAILRGSLLLHGTDPAAHFTGERHAPAALSDVERAPARPLDGAPRPVRLDLPDWLEDELAGVDEAALEALRSRAPLDLRANLLKTDVAGAIAALAAEGVVAEPAGLTPAALRVREGARRVAGSTAFAHGLVEVQDAASQAAAAMAAARPGETVLDLCAGGGGKTLALAAAMEGRGQLLAHDIAARRIAALPARAERAGARVEIVPTARLNHLRGACDLVFVDAPCSGSGAWRRNPDAKWRLVPGELARLEEAQDSLLDQAAGLARPGGRVLYATCSILPRENRARVEAFLARHAGWRLCAARAFMPPEGDGFFAALLDKAGKARES